MDDWIAIRGFSSYSVSPMGDIRNEDTGKLLRPKTAQNGQAFVGLMRRGEQRQRSIALIVAQTFLPRPPTEYFDTPINLDGDRFNNRADNLAWRPRWFAIKYNHQFRRVYQNRIENPLRDDEGQEYRDSFEAAVKNGLLENELVLGVLNRAPVWPTYQEFFVILD